MLLITHSMLLRGLVDLTGKLLLAIPCLLIISSCNNSDLERFTNLYTVNANSTGFTVVEGDTNGVNVPLSLTRSAEFNGDVSISATGASSRDDANLVLSVANPVLTGDQSETTLNVQLAIANAPLMPQERAIVITAASAQFSQQTTIEFKVEPVNAPDVYLLIGQSNMVGFGGDNQKEAGPGQPDEPLDRIKQLNVSGNSPDVFLTASDYTDVNVIARQPLLVRAEDPLHLPQDQATQSKLGTYIGPGLSFAKAALNHTTKDIILVPAAWSASGFCGGSTLDAHWNATPTFDVDLGNTLLFERAVARTNLTLNVSGGILRGILWHQGEADSNRNFPRCSQLYQSNLVNLVTRLRAEIQPDARGGIARGENSDIPFIAGTMSRGIDTSNSAFSPEKELVDSVHRSIGTLVPFADFANFDDLTPETGFPCGNDGCVHFGTLAYREIGKRYYATLAIVAGQ